ncbi:unnamed protein product [Dicrocoelium dendriticum]|nr:unnamed protein product [Dicrocoelium dendriticum]
MSIRYPMQGASTCSLFHSQTLTNGVSAFSAVTPRHRSKPFGYYWNGSCEETRLCAMYGFPPTWEHEARKFENPHGIHQYSRQWLRRDESVLPSFNLSTTVFGKDTGQDATHGDSVVRSSAGGCPYTAWDAEGPPDEFPFIGCVRDTATGTARPNTELCFRSKSTDSFGRTDIDLTPAHPIDLSAHRTVSNDSGTCSTEPVLPILSEAQRIK